MQQQDQSEITAETIELTLEQGRAATRKLEAFNRLVNNPDYEEVIHQVYFKDEPARLVQAMAHPNMQSPESQEHIQKQLSAIGMFKQFMIKLKQEGEHAKAAMQAAEIELDRLNDPDYDEDDE